MLLRASVDAGATFTEVSNGYIWSRQDNGSTVSSTNYSSLVLTPATSNNQDNYDISGTIQIINPASPSEYKTVMWDISYLSSTDVLQVIRGAGKIKTLEPINGLRVIPSAGSIQSGTITLNSI